MSISNIALRAQTTWLPVALTVGVIGCCNCNLSPFTPSYQVRIQTLPLPPGVNQDPTQFRNQAAARGVGPSHTQQRLGDCAGCVVNVQIAPLGDTREVNPAKAKSPLAPQSGRPVVKILNVDPTHAEEMYGFRPSSQFEYYVWADTSLSQARMTLLEVPAVGQPGAVRAIFQKNLQLCLHDASAPRFSDADFRWCEGVHVSTAQKVNHADMLPLATLASLLSRVSEVVLGMPTLLEPPIWLRCTDGCCG